MLHLSPEACAQAEQKESNVSKLLPIALALALPWERAHKRIATLVVATAAVGLPALAALFWHASFDNSVWFRRGDPFGQDAGYGSIIPVGTDNSGPTDSPTTIIDSNGSSTSGDQQSAAAQQGAKPVDNGQPAVPATGLSQQQPASPPPAPSPQPVGPGSDSTGGLY